MQVLRRHRLRRQDHQLHHRLHAHRRPLGLERQRPSVLGLHVSLLLFHPPPSPPNPTNPPSQQLRRQTPTPGTPNPPLRLGPQFAPPPLPIPLRARVVIFLVLPPPRRPRRQPGRPLQHRRRRLRRRGVPLVARHAALGRVQRRLRAQLPRPRPRRRRLPRAAPRRLRLDGLRW